LRVITAPGFGPPEVLRIEERPIPRPKADEVVVEVRAAGVNLMDGYLRRGMHPSAPLPLVLGVRRPGRVARGTGKLCRNGGGSGRAAAGQRRSLCVDLGTQVAVTLEEGRSTPGFSGTAR